MADPNRAGPKGSARFFFAAGNKGGTLFCTAREGVLDGGSQKHPACEWKDRPASPAPPVILI